MATRAGGGVERKLRPTGREEAKGKETRESETQAVGDCSQSNVVGSIYGHASERGSGKKVKTNWTGGGQGKRAKRE